jgi:hypothetical protein
MRFFKALWCGTEPDERPERRHAPRREMTTVCATSFCVGHDERRALLLDLSKTGARFGTAVDAHSISLDSGDVVSFHVSTPYGAATWTGRIIWTRLADTVYTWGVEFTNIPQTEDEALKRLLAA